MSSNPTFRLRRAVLAVVLAAGMLVVPLATSASAATVPPVETVGADALPTWQVNGVVWSQAVIGTTVYVTGSFSAARPPGVPSGGAGEVPAQNIFAYDIRSGEPVAGFTHALNGQGLVIRASDDGSRVYVGGDFTAVNGTARGHLAAFSTDTGALLPWSPNVGGQVRGLAVTPYTVFVGGNFPSANGLQRTHLASFEVGSAAITDWAPAVAGDGGYVWAMVMSPDASQVVVGGSFATLNGVPAYGMGALDASTGATRPWAAQERIRTAGLDGAITSLKADDTSVYGSGYSYGAGASFEGTFAADPDGGEIRWVNDCLGDTYDVSPLAGALYSVGHAHDCSVIGGFPDTVPRSRWQRAMASSLTPSGITTVTDQYGWDFRGLPHTELLQWYPDLAFGTYTPARQAAWSVEGSGDYVVLGGEFPTVNGVAQQGLVRFLDKSVGPHSIKPHYLTSMNPVATSTEAGSVRIRFGSTWDADDEQLTYDVYRDGGPSIGSVTSTSVWWKLPPLVFTDTGRTPGATHTYQVRAKDAAGNVQWSLTTNGVVVSGAPRSAYADLVRADGAQHLWRLDSGATPSPDAIGPLDLSLASLSQATGIDGGALRSSGSASSRGSTTFAQPKPDAVTIEAWVKTTSGRGGRIIGLGNSATGASSAYDLALYLGNNGRVNLGVRDAANTLATTTSAQAVNDGLWHHVVGVVDGGGSSIVIDGRRSGRNQNGTGGPDVSGYWRVFGDSTSGLANRPADTALAGTVDEVAVYPAALPIDTIRAHYTALTGQDPAAATPTDPYGASVATDDPDIYWRLGEASGPVARDTSASASDGTLTGVASYGRSGAVTGTSDTALVFNGTSGFAASRQAWGAPTEYSTEAWLQTTTTRGGRIVGFGSSATALSGSFDRLVCMQNDGRLLFGVNSGAQQSILSPTSYNDGQWHHVVATQGADGMRLYVDGIQQGANPTTTGQAYPGYWRAGGDRCFSGSTSSYFAGVIDEVAVYPRALSSSAVVQHFVAGGGILPNLPSTAVFTGTASFLSVTFDGSGSTDPDGQVASYAWTFGDGTTGTGATPTHVYAAAGTYPVTLTVTDDDGATSVETGSVTVVVNTAPSSAFTTSSAGLTVSVDASASADGDGTIASYHWEFGDGASATGVTATHEYASEGTYTVLLTVTDDQGATGTTTGEVTVVRPPNLPPTAAFESTTSFLDVALDASRSVDPDGTLASYAWDFGDGTTGTGPTASHAYAAAGAYTVRLTVTDDGGATDSTTTAVEVVADSSVARDAFGRSVTDGWGAADRGGDWSLSGAPSWYSVAGGAGSVSLGPGSGAKPTLGSVSITDVDLSTVLTTDKAPTGGGQYFSLVGRAVPGGSEYRAKLVLASTGAVTAYLTRVDTGTETSLGGSVIPGLSYAPGTRLHARFQAVGTSPTTLRVKVWPQGQAEPATWPLSRTDATAALQAPGSIGFYLYLSGSATNAPVDFTLDDVWVGPPPP